MKIEMIKDANDNTLFELYSIGVAIGYGRMKVVKGREYQEVQKSRINKNVNGGNIEIFEINNKKYLDINGVRQFVSLSHTNNKQNFINWLKDNKYIDHKEVFAKERKETLFIDMLEQALEPFGIKGIRQYQVLALNNESRYRIDYYIPSLNIAIEYDESKHNEYSYDQHEGRQLDIEIELGCRFIRVSDSNSNAYNIGYVIREIVSYKNYISKIA